MPEPKAMAMAVFGARGTGKTAFVKQHIEATNPPRLAVWDFKHDPDLKSIGTAHTDIRAFIRAMQASAFRLRFLPDHTLDMKAQFEVFCKACWTASRLVMFVDELPEVTKAGHAPPAWRRCVNVGRMYTAPDGKPGWLSIIGAGQRAAECDKSFTSNADIVHCGRLSHEDDAKSMAKVLVCTTKELMTLPNLHWVERRSGQIEPLRGVLTFKNTPESKNISLQKPAAKKALRKTA